MLNPCEGCPDRVFGTGTEVEGLRSQIAAYREFVQKMMDIYARAPAAVQCYLLQEYSREGLLKQKGSKDAE